MINAKKKIAAIGAPLALLIGALIIHHSGVMATDKDDDTPAASSPSGNPLALSEDEIRESGIKTAAVEQQTLNETIQLMGTIVPNEEKIAEITPRITGHINSVKAALGDKVAAGDVLALLDSVELTETRAAYLLAKSDVGVADAELARSEGLAKEKGISEKDFLRTRADAERAHASLQAALSKLRLFGVSPDDQGQVPDTYPLIAPFAGTVTEREAVLGENAEADKTQFTITDLSTVWLEADVFEQDLSKVEKGAKARVTVVAYPDRVFEGTLTYLGDTMDKATRTIKARVELQNVDGKLKPGMFASAQIQSDNKTSELAVPQDAVILVQDKPSVFVVKGTGFVPRAVETAPAVGGWIPVKAGLEPGERIAVSGVYVLKARLLKSQIGADND